MAKSLSMHGCARGRHLLHKLEEFVNIISHQTRFFVRVVAIVGGLTTCRSVARGRRAGRPKPDATLADGTMVGQACSPRVRCIGGLGRPARVSEPKAGDDHGCDEIIQNAAAAARRSSPCTLRG